MRMCWRLAWRDTIAAIRGHTGYAIATLGAAIGLAVISVLSGAVEGLWLSVLVAFAGLVATGLIVFLVSLATASGRINNYLEHELAKARSASAGPPVRAKILSCLLVLEKQEDGLWQVGGYIRVEFASFRGATINHVELWSLVDPALQRRVPLGLFADPHKVLPSEVKEVLACEDIVIPVGDKSVAGWIPFGVSEDDQIHSDRSSYVLSSKNRLKFRFRVEGSDDTWAVTASFDKRGSQLATLFGADEVDPGFQAKYGNTVDENQETVLDTEW